MSDLIRQMHEDGVMSEKVSMDYTKAPRDAFDPFNEAKVQGKPFDPVTTLPGVREERFSGEPIFQTGPVGGTAPMAYPDDNPKTVMGLKKPGMRNVPLTALIPLLQAMDNGAGKYGTHNWREKTVSASIYIDAIWRHWGLYRDGEDIAADSLVLHLGHIMACCAILIDAAQHGRLNDDRIKSDAFKRMLEALEKKD